VRAERDPQQLRNCLNGLQLYRANFIACARRPRERRTQVPVQFIVPRFDRYVTPAMSERRAMARALPARAHRRAALDRGARRAADRRARASLIAWARNEASPPVQAVEASQTSDARASAA
jgi:hypothetical protein